MIVQAGIGRYSTKLRKFIQRPISGAPAITIISAGGRLAVAVSCAETDDITDASDVEDDLVLILLSAGILNRIEAGAS